MIRTALSALTALRVLLRALKALATLVALSAVLQSWALGCVLQQRSGSFTTRLCGVLGGIQCLLASHLDATNHDTRLLRVLGNTAPLHWCLAVGWHTVQGSAFNPLGGTGVPAPVNATCWQSSR